MMMVVKMVNRLLHLASNLTKKTTIKAQITLIVNNSILIIRLTKSY